MRSIARSAPVLVPAVLLLVGSCLAGDDDLPPPAAPRAALGDAYSDEADHDAPVIRVEAELLDSTDDVLRCGMLMVREPLHFRLVRVVDGSPMPREFVARVTCPERMKRGDRVRLELQPMVAHPDVYDVVGEPMEGAPFVETLTPDPRGAAVTVDATVSFVDPAWPSCAGGDVVKPVSFEVLRVVEGQLDRPYIDVLWRCPRELRLHEVQRLTLRPAARRAEGPPRFVVVAATPSLPHTAFDPGGATAVVEARLFESTKQFPSCDISPRAALTFEADRLVEGTWPGSVLTVMVGCPAELHDGDHYRLTLRAYPPLGYRTATYAAEVVPLPSPQ